MVSFAVSLVDEVPAVIRAWAELDACVDDMVAERRRGLTDDLLSDLIRAENNGDRLNADELHMMVASLLVAGTDTTRNPLGRCPRSRRACAIHRRCAARFAP